MVEYHLAINRTKSIPQCGWSPKILCWRKEARHKSPHSMWFCLYERGYASKNGEEPLPIFPPQKQWENWQMWSKSTSLQVLIINQRLAVICKAFIPEKKKSLNLLPLNIIVLRDLRVVESMNLKPQMWRVDWEGFHGFLSPRGLSPLIPAQFKGQLYIAKWNVYWQLTG